MLVYFECLFLIASDDLTIDKKRRRMSGRNVISGSLPNYNILANQSLVEDIFTENDIGTVLLSIQITINLKYYF